MEPTRCRRPVRSLRAMAVEFPEVAGHPNRLPFTGCLTLVDVPSDRAPSGARGHRVVLTRAAAEAALPSLLGMAVDYKAGWDGHDARQKCGIITAAELHGQRLMVRGFLFARDYPELHRLGPAAQPGAGSAMAAGGALAGASSAAGNALAADAEAAGAHRPMGMSYELADAHVADMRAALWRITRATFTGAAILLREKAAYRGTSFQIQRRSSTPAQRRSGPTAAAPQATA